MELYALIVKGDKCKWVFDVWVDPQYINEWRLDGLEIYKSEGPYLKSEDDIRPSGYLIEDIV